MDIKLPKLGEGAESGTVAAVLVSEGDTIEKDQPIIELESEKAVASIPASAAGKVTKIHVSTGDKLSVGGRILTVDAAGGGEDGDADKADRQEAGKPKKTKAKKKAPAKEEDDSDTEEEEDEDVDASEADEFDEDAPEPAASPSVRFIANQLGLDLRRVKQGADRVTADDLKSYVSRLQKLAAKPKPASGGMNGAAKPAASPLPDFTRYGGILKKPMSQLRKVISRRMAENWNRIPHVTQFDDADVTQLLALRKRFAPEYEKAGVKLTVTPLLLKALVGALKDHLIFNSSLDETAEEIILKEYFHIGLAVDSDPGLMVPVIRDVDKKSVLELSREIAELADKVRSRKIGGDEMKGGTFTISNQGAFGGAHFTPIVNHPEVAILGLGRGADKPVVVDGKVEVRTMLPLTISYDHRVIDGGAAARFAVDLVKSIETLDEALLKL